VSRSQSKCQPAGILALVDTAGTGWNAQAQITASHFKMDVWASASHGGQDMQALLRRPDPQANRPVVAGFEA
jgi:hypothetical protein